MKRGRRKLCDVYLGPQTPLPRFELMCQQVEAHLNAQRIDFGFDTHSKRSHGGRQFRRYWVWVQDVRRATDGLPLELRGFKSSITKWAGE